MMVFVFGVIFVLILEIGGNVKLFLMEVVIGIIDNFVMIVKLL